MLSNLRNQLQSLLNFSLLNKNYCLDFIIKSNEVGVINNFTLCKTYDHIFLNLLMSSLIEEDLYQKILDLTPEIRSRMLSFFLLLDSQHFLILFQLCLFLLLFFRLLNLCILLPWLPLRLRRSFLLFLLLVFLRWGSSWLPACNFKRTSISFWHIKLTLWLIPFLHSSLAKCVIFVILETLTQDMECFQIKTLTLWVDSCKLNPRSQH